MAGGAAGRAVGLPPSESFGVSRFVTTIGIAALLGASTPAWAGAQGSLSTSSGGTGVSSRGGSGGTGLSSHGSAKGSLRGIGAPSSTRAATPASGTQHQMTPAKPHNTPPAGVRPHTDLAAATKLITLSSANLTKHSQLFPKMPLPPGAPSLVGPVLNNIGPTQGGSASFKAVAGIPTALSNGRVYPTHGGGTGGGKPGHSLSGSAHVTAMTVAEASTGGGTGEGGGWLLLWLKNCLCGLGVAGLGWWMWQQVPKGAKMALPARIPA
jgi:hypothetical protein